MTASRLWAMLNTDNSHRLMVGIGDAAYTIRLLGGYPCSGTHCLARTFTTAPPLIACLQPPVEDYADLLVPHCIGIDFALLGLYHQYFMPFSALSNMA